MSAHSPTPWEQRLDRVIEDADGRTVVYVETRPDTDAAEDLDGPLDRVARLLDTPLDEQCRCAPGMGSPEPDGTVICEVCGLLMIAATAGQLIDQARELLELEGGTDAV